MANTPFKLKSGNTTPFKQMGSSKVLQAKIAKEFKLPVSQKSSMPKNFNIKGDPSTTPGYKDTKIGKKLSATGGDKSLEKLKKRRIANTKAGKIIKFGEGSNIIADKGLDSQGRNTWGDKVGKAKKVAGKAKKVAGKATKVLGKVAKFAAKRLGPVGAAVTAYEVGKTIPKVAKATVKGLKKRTKKETETGYKNPGVRKI